MGKNSDPNIVKALYSTFTFVGKPVFSKTNELVKETTSEKGTTSKISFGVKTSDTNIVYVEMVGFTSKGSQKIYTLDKNNKKLEIDFKERNSKAIIDNVADFKKFEIQLGADKKEFLAEVDAINELKSLDKDMNYLIRGEVKYERYYSGKAEKTLFLTKYLIKSVTALTDPDKVKPNAKATIEFVYNKDGIDESNFKTDKKIYYSVYVTSYDKDSKKNVFMPLNLVINAENVDLENEKQKKLLQFLTGGLKIKDKKSYAFQVETSVMRGVEKREIAIEDLTEFEQNQIEVGMITLEEISRRKPSNSVAGDKVNELRIVKFGGKSIYASGKVETDYEEDDFILPDLTPKREKLVILDEEGTKPPFDIDEKDDKDQDLEDLFS